MSRIGNRIIEIPSDVTVDVDGTTFTVKGPKGELENTLNDQLEYKFEDNTIVIDRPDDSIDMRSIHGTSRSLLDNMIQGVSKGFTKELELVGVGYRAQMQGDKLVLNVGLSHPVEFQSTDTLSISVEGNTNVKIEGINAEEVGALASNIRAVRPPEPYKGKGIRYKNEYVRNKEGKTGK